MSAILNEASNQHLETQIEGLQCQADEAISKDLDASTPITELLFAIGPQYWLDCRGFDLIGTAGRLRKPITGFTGGRDR